MKLPTEELGLSAAQIDGAGAHWTAREVLQQPAVWEEIGALMAREAERLAAFLAPLLGQAQLRIVLTGAGTSAFIGECLAPPLTGTLARRVEAIATTDLVASPRSYLLHDTPTLLVSFARSGNSPESVAALELAERCVAHCAHLIVTCNAQGELYRRAEKARNACVILLPEATNDRGFAMTSSFSGMLLAAALAFGVMPRERTAALARLAAHVLPGNVPLLQSLARAGFGRIVYLGSRELKGLAREAALKMLELTDGRVVAVADAPLGFRHGPKSILNADTLVVAFRSNDPYTQRYDADLVRELRHEAVALRVMTLGGRTTVEHADDVVLETAPEAAPATDLELCFPYALFAQTLALLRALALGIRPDTPSTSGTVNRVVQGVTIHPYGRPA